MAGDLTAPASLDAALDGIEAMFLTSPHRTPHAFFQQPNGMRALHAEIEDRLMEAGLATNATSRRSQRVHSWTRGTPAWMLLGAWGATLGHRAFVTDTVSEVTGSPARAFGQWAVDHADAFRGELQSD